MNTPIIPIKNSKRPDFTTDNHAAMPPIAALMRGATQYPKNNSALREPGSIVSNFTTLIPSVV